MNILVFSYDDFPVRVQDKKNTSVSFAGKGLKPVNSVPARDLKSLKPFSFTPFLCQFVPSFENRWLLIKSGRNQYILTEAVERQCIFHEISSACNNVVLFSPRWTSARLWAPGCPGWPRTNAASSLGALDHALLGNSPQILELGVSVFLFGKISLHLKPVLEEGKQKYKPT